jgi:hypothetical protein
VSSRGSSTPPHPEPGRRTIVIVTHSRGSALGSGAPRAHPSRLVARLCQSYLQPLLPMEASTSRGLEQPLAEAMQTMFVFIFAPCGCSAECRTSQPGVSGAVVVDSHGLLLASEHEIFSSFICLVAESVVYRQGHLVGRLRSVPDLSARLTLSRLGVLRSIWTRAKALSSQSDAQPIVTVDSDTLYAFPSAIPASESNLFAVAFRSLATPTELSPCTKLENRGHSKKRDNQAPFISLLQRVGLPLLQSARVLCWPASRGSRATVA